MKSLGGGNKAIDTIKSPHKRETFYEIRNIAHKKENKENIKERLFSQPRKFNYSQTINSVHDGR